MTDRIKLGLIGCGFFAQNHLHAWRDLESQGIDIVAVCDVDPAKAKHSAEKFGVPHWYSEAETMFRERDLGLVDITTRMDTHRELVELAMARRVPTIVQKPFGPDLAACVAMTTAADDAGVFLAVHENFRFQAPFRKVADELRSGVIGEPSWARISFRTGFDIYKGQPYLRNEDRFVVMDVGVHVLDLARVLLGEVAYIAALTQRRNPAIRGEDTATMLLKHRAGGVSVVECTYEARRLPDNFPETLLEIEGAVGAIVLRAGATMEVTAHGSMTSSSVDAAVPSWAARPNHIIQESVLATCSHILGSLKAGRNADTSGRDNLKTVALCEAAYESALTGKTVQPAFA